MFGSWELERQGGTGYTQREQMVARGTNSSCLRLTIDHGVLIKDRLQISLLILTLSWPSFLSYRNQSIDLQSKSMDWFLYDRYLRHERVKWFNQLLFPLKESVFEMISRENIILWSSNYRLLIKRLLIEKTNVYSLKHIPTKHYSLLSSLTFFM